MHTVSHSRTGSHQSVLGTSTDADDSRKLPKTRYPLSIAVGYGHVALLLCLQSYLLRKANHKCMQLSMSCWPTTPILPAIWVSMVLKSMSMCVGLWTQIPIFSNQSLFATTMDVIYGDTPLIHVDEIWHHSRSNLQTLRLSLTNSTWLGTQTHGAINTVLQFYVGSCIIYVIRYHYANPICLYRLTLKCVSNTSRGFQGMPGWPDVWAATSSCSSFCTLWTCITGGRSASSVEEDSLLNL